MKVDFDNLRKKIANDYNGLYLLSNKIENKELQESCKMILDNLRDCVATLLCCEQKEAGIYSVDYKLLPCDEDEEE